MTSVLLVCTANQCRSPMATAILRRRFEERNIQASVASAGLYEGGHPAIEGALQALRARGLDASAHRSRRLEADLVRTADLVLGLERAHVREVVVLEPAAWSRTFTVKELVRRGGSAGRRSAKESLSGWLGRVHAGRRRADLLGASSVDDIDDPTGGSPEDYEATADEIDVLAEQLVDLGWGEAGGEHGA